MPFILESEPCRLGNCALESNGDIQKLIHIMHSKAHESLGFKEHQPVVRHRLSLPVELPINSRAPSVQLEGSPRCIFGKLSGGFQT